MMERIVGTITACTQARVIYRRLALVLARPAVAPARSEE